MNARSAIALIATACVGACALVFAFRGNSTEAMAFVMLIVPSPLQLSTATLGQKEEVAK